MRSFSIAAAEKRAPLLEGMCSQTSLKRFLRTQDNVSVGRVHVVSTSFSGNFRSCDVHPVGSC